MINQIVYLVLCIIMKYMRSLINFLKIIFRFFGVFTRAISVGSRVRVFGFLADFYFIGFC